MTRPEQFPQPYVSLSNLPYLYGENGSARQTLTGGVLPRGRVIWTNDLKEPLPSAVLAFVEEIGIVLVDPRWLVSRDVLQEGAGQ